MTEICQSTRAPVTLNVVCFRHTRSGLDGAALDRLNDDILVERQEQGIAAPSGTTIGGKYVLVIGEGNVVEQRYVQPGALQLDSTIVIEAGLDGSETYIVDGLLRARPGLPVTPMTREQVAAAQAAAEQERAAEEADGEE